MAVNAVSLRPAWIIGALSTVAVLLVVASIASQLALYSSSHPAFMRVSKLL